MVWITSLKGVSSPLIPHLSPLIPQPNGCGIRGQRWGIRCILRGQGWSIRGALFAGASAGA